MSAAFDIRAVALPVSPEPLRASFRFVYQHNFTIIARNCQAVRENKKNCEGKFGKTLDKWKNMCYT